MTDVRLGPFFGAALRRDRERAKVRPAEIAAATGRDQATVWRWEKGKNWPENPDTIAEHYGNLTGASPLDLWDEAIKDARKAEAAEKKKLGDMLSPTSPTTDAEPSIDEAAGRAVRDTSKAERGRRRRRAAGS